MLAASVAIRRHFQRRMDRNGILFGAAERVGLLQRRRGQRCVSVSDDVFEKVENILSLRTVLLIILVQNSPINLFGCSRAVDKRVDIPPGFIDELHLATRDFNRKLCEWIRSAAVTDLSRVVLRSPRSVPKQFVSGRRNNRLIWHKMNMKLRNEIVCFKRRLINRQCRRNTQTRDTFFLYSQVAF